jgi:WD40 repeat protein/transcriptional regulator with XRE-family HTH domain
MARYLPFYQQLRRERIRRNWSQAEVAAKLGVDAKTVSRWEKGSSIPFPYYRQMLCQLFEKSAEEFGLIEDYPSEELISAASEVGSSQLTWQPESNNSTELPPPFLAESRNEDTLPNAFQDPPLRADWGEAPDISNFFGRELELVELKKWIIDDRCRMITILGMGGLGKTTLCAELAGQIKKYFSYVFWRSLQNAPPLEEILQQCLQFLSNQQLVDLPRSPDKQITLLIQYLRKHRCLLVFDNAESILQIGERAGQYQKGYENYGTLLQRIGEVQHMSCLLLTSREKPKEMGRLTGKSLPVRSLHLHGIGYVEGQELLKEKDIFGSQEQWRNLVDLYSGNPLALKLVSESIAGIFEGNIAKFLAEGALVFGDINDLLDQQFLRLSTREQEILYWLAIEREAVPLEEIREDFVRSPSKGELLDALDSLQRRSLIETRGAACFTLQAVILEYMTNMLTKQMYEEFRGVAGVVAEVWTNYALMKAQTKDYVRDSQIRLILNPVAEQLVGTIGKEGIEQKLRSLLSTQRQIQLQQRTYLTGNALNLLVHLNYDLRGSDFSSLTIRQAYLQNVALPNVNLANAHFEASVFTNTFGNILSVAFSPDGTLLITGTASGEIWIYQALSGSPLRTCYGHTDGVFSVAFSSDKRMFASSSDDQTVRLWDVSTGQCLKILYGHINRVRSVSFGSNNSVVASGSEDATIRLWDVSTGDCLMTLREHNNRVWSVDFSSDGKILVSGSEDTTIRLWDVSTGQCLRTLHGHTSGIRSVAFSPDNAILASGGDDQTVRFWNVSTGHCLKILHEHTNRLWSVAFNPNGNILASGGEDQIIRLWDIHSGRCLKMLLQHTQGVRSIAFNSDGQTLASGGEDQAVRLWDVSTGYCLKTLQGYTNRIRSITFAPDGEMLASGGEDQTIQLWNITSGRCLYILKDHVEPVRSIVFSPDGRILASGGDDQKIRLWDVSSGQCFTVLQGHINWIWAVAFSPDGRTLASGGEDQVVRLWDVSSGQCLSILQGHTSWVRSIAFSPDGYTIASGSDDETIRLWETETGRCLNSLEGHIGRVRSVAFSPDGHTIASGSEDQTIRLWDISTGRCLQILQGHTNWVRSVSYSPDGLSLASGSDDQTIHVWDMSTNHPLRILQGHTNRIRSVIFSSNGQILASGSDDGTIKIWDLREGKCIKTLISERPYERMNITGVSGLTEAQITTLKLLGAVEDKGSAVF